MKEDFTILYQRLQNVKYEGHSYDLTEAFSPDSMRKP